MQASQQPVIVPVWPERAPAPGEPAPHEQHGYVPPSMDIRIVRNVVHPTLAIYLPPAELATGTGVMVCPGGAFRFLAIEHEGDQVARWLNAHGIAAFVLRYSLLPTPDDDEEFARQLRENMADRARMRAQMQQIGTRAIEDGQQAMRAIRRRASELRLAPDRIGVLGFSAGGVVATGMAAHFDAESRPSFAAPIYTAPREIGAVPDDAPPLFLALAADDDMAVNASLPLFSAWRAAGRPAELHVYARGGHGFGMRANGLPSDQWIAHFAAWLAGEGFYHSTA